jgi:hypothetical protein
MPPALSTTLAGTERSPVLSSRRRRSAVLALVLIAEFITAALLVRPTVNPGEAPAGDGAARTPVAVAPPAASTLVVGDGRTVQLLGMGGTTTSGLLRRIATQIGGAVDAVVAFWGADWQHDIIIVAAGSDDQFRRLTNGPPGQQMVDIAAAAVADSVDPVRRTATGQRIVFAEGAAAMTDDALRIVVRHELFHFASRADTALDAPRWLTEGVADYIGRPETARPGPGMAAELARLPSDTDFDAAGPTLSQVYDRAWWFCRFVADTYGAPALRALYLRAGGVGHPDPGTALRQVLGVDEPELLARWQRWLAASPS